MSTTPVMPEKKGTEKMPNMDNKHTASDAEHHKAVGTHHTEALKHIENKDATKAKGSVTKAHEHLNAMTAPKGDSKTIGSQANHHAAVGEHHKEALKHLDAGDHTKAKESVTKAHDHLTQMKAPQSDHSANGTHMPTPDNKTGDMAKK